MKAIRIIGITVLVVIGLFFSIGLLYDTVEYTSKVRVGKSVIESWDIFTNPDNASEWIPNFKRFEKISGEPMAPGSRWRLIVENNGEEFEMVETMREVIKYKQFSFELDNDVFTSLVDITFSSIDSTTTEIKAKSSVFGKGAFFKSVVALSKSYFQEQGNESYQKLKHMIESK